MTFTSSLTASIVNNVSANPQIPQNTTDFVSASIYSPPVNIQKINEHIENALKITRLQYPQDIPKYYTILEISDYTRNDLMTIGATKVENVVVLPLPGIMIDNQQVDYEEKPLNAFGAIGQGATNLKNLGAAGDGVGGAADNSGGAIATAGAFATGGVAKGVGGILNQVIPGASKLVGSGTDALRAVTGYTPNQFLTILLKGPRYKRPTLSWILAPRNQKEAKDIQQIILALNQAMSPVLAAGGFLFGFPKIFQIGFMPNSAMLFKFKPAVLTDCQVNYTPVGQPAFFRQTSDFLENAPAAVEIKLQFLELEFWLKRGNGYDYNDSNDIRGGNGYRGGKKTNYNDLFEVKPEADRNDPVTFMDQNTSGGSGG